MPLPAEGGIRAGVQQPPGSGPDYFLVPDPALSMLEGLLLDELPDFILPVEVPVVVPFFMFVCLVVLCGRAGAGVSFAGCAGGRLHLCERRCQSTATARMRKPVASSSWETPLIEATLQPSCPEKGSDANKGTAIKPTRAPEVRTAAA